MPKPLGLYLHIPFCAKKCAYCDFYSAFATGDKVDSYLFALKKEIKRWGGLVDRPIDTIYIGGGTPSIIGEKISPLLDTVYESFSVDKNAEITVEANPDMSDDFLHFAKSSGVNRLSIGVQSGIDNELKLLGRTHNTEKAKHAFLSAREAGFSNISLDLMLCLPSGSIETLSETLDFFKALNPEHISAYMLKIEKNTALYKNKNLILPDDDNSAKQYLYVCDYLENIGYSHYEISNFAKPECESRHNLKYWNDLEYIGIGPSAHSFYGGKRFFYPRDLNKFIIAPETVSDGSGGYPEEKLMLGLRLKKGINIEEIYFPVPQEIKDTLSLLKKAELINLDFPNISLTDKGMLVSNSIITELTL